MFDGKKVLITGGTGFLGKRLVDSLSNYHKNLEIILSVRKNRLNHNAQGKFRFIINEIDKDFYFDEQVDIVMHIASEIDNKKDMWSINYYGTKRILHWCEKFGVKKIIYVSSISVFGNNNDTIITENSICQPLNLYGKSKYAAENLIINFCTTNKIKYLILRPTNIIDAEINPESNSL